MGAPKGNKNAVGNEGGRPPKFTNRESLEEKVDDYFRELEFSGEPATVTGLTLHLGFDSRDTLYQYEKKVEFSDVIKRARLKVEHGYEKQLFEKVSTGAIFALKNMGWKDKNEIDHTTNGKDIAPPVSWIKPSKDE